MKLSEALRFGISLRAQGPRDGDRFTRMESGELRSDPWAAACEAVQPSVATFNWGSKDQRKLQSACDALNAVQHHYFKEYFSMPAVCPGSHQPYVEAGGRIINRKNEMKIEGERIGDLGGVTSECTKVSQMAGMVDHLFYAHGWSREQVLEVVEWYENTRTLSLLNQTFQHYQNPGSRSAQNHALTQQSLQFLRKRKQQRGY